MYKEMTTEELEQQLKQGKPVNLIDVRELDEWEEGHISSARLIPLSEFTQRIGELAQDDQEIVLICRSGGRSGRACEYLDAQGYDVVNVTGGMLAWQGDIVTGA